MTTVAYKDGTLAADSRATLTDGTMSNRTVKLWKIVSKVDPVKGRVILAIAGDLYGGLLFHDWLKAGNEPNLHGRGVEDGTDFDALILHRSGLYAANRLCRVEKITEPYWAIGSGRLAAMTAMYCGKKAPEAVKIAGLFDPGTGGRIVVMTLEDLKNGKSLNVK